MTRFSSLQLVLVARLDLVTLDIPIPLPCLTLKTSLHGTRLPSARTRRHPNRLPLIFTGSSLTQAHRSRSALLIEHSWTDFRRLNRSFAQFLLCTPKLIWPHQPDKSIWTASFASSVSSCLNCKRRPRLLFLHLKVLLTLPPSNELSPHTHHTKSTHHLRDCPCGLVQCLRSAANESFHYYSLKVHRDSLSRPSNSSTFEQQVRFGKHFRRTNDPLIMHRYTNSRGDRDRQSVKANRHTFPFNTCFHFRSFCSVWNNTSSTSALDLSSCVRTARSSSFERFAWFALMFVSQN
jgi:hypothetical protein